MKKSVIIILFFLSCSVSGQYIIENDTALLRLNKVKCVKTTLRVDHYEFINNEYTKPQKIDILYIKCFDSEGRIISEQEGNGPYFRSYCKFTYDENGNEIIVEGINLDLNSYTFHNSSQYDSNRIVKTDYRSIEYGELSHSIIEYVYDSLNLVEKIFYEQDGELNNKKTTSKWKYYYNSKNLIEKSEWFAFKNDSIFILERGTNYQYDSSNNLIFKKSFQFSIPIHHPYGCVQFFYDEDGNKIKEKWSYGNDTLCLQPLTTYHFNPKTGKVELICNETDTTFYYYKNERLKKIEETRNSKKHIIIYKYFYYSNGLLKRIVSSDKRNYYFDYEYY